MSIPTAIARFRGRQAEQFTARATVLRPTGDSDFDEDTGIETPELVTIYEDRPCKVTSVEQIGTDVTAGAAAVRLLNHLVKFAVGSDVAAGDTILITASTYNEAHVGIAYLVTDIDRREWQIAHRCVVEETTVPTMVEGS